MPEIPFSFIFYRYAFIYSSPCRQAETAEYRLCKMGPRGDTAAVRSCRRRGNANAGAPAGRSPVGRRTTPAGAFPRPTARRAALRPRMGKGAGGVFAARRKRGGRCPDAGTALQTCQPRGEPPARVPPGPPSCAFLWQSRPRPLGAGDFAACAPRPEGAALWTPATF